MAEVRGVKSAKGVAPAGVGRPLQVMVVDDHPVMRAATRRFLDAEDDIDVIAEAGAVDSALAAASSSERLDVIVLDLSLPGQSGLDGAAALRRRYKGVRILMLTVYADPDIARRALENGVDGFLTKGCAPAELVAAVRAVAHGERYVPSWVSQALGAGRRSSALSPREIEVLRLLIDGVRVTDIADQLGISLKTASTFKTRIHQKTGCHTLDQLIGYAVQHQLLPTSTGGELF